MKPEQEDFIIKPIIITTASDKWFFEELDLVQRIMQQMPYVVVEPFRIRHVEKGIDITTYEGSDGKVRIDQRWFKKLFTEKYVGLGFNLIIFHMSREERDVYNLHPTINASYWRDNDRYLECWISASEGQYPPRNRTQIVIDPDTGEEVDITEFQRLILHECGHGVTHFSGRREEIAVKLGIAPDASPTHYLDYKEHNVGEIYQITSFQKWSLMAYITHLATFVVKLLTLQLEREVTTQPKPEPEPQPSMLYRWALAIQEFEDYVRPGETYRDGTIAPNGSLSYRHHNPGNLRWSPFQAGSAKGFAYFNSYEDGFKALLHQLQIAVDGRSSAYSPNMTLLEFFQKYAPSSDNNHPQTYANFVALRLGVDVDTVISNLA